MKNPYYFTRTWLPGIFCILFSVTISAQMLWTDVEAGNSLSVELLKPFKSDSINMGFTDPSGTLFFTGRYALKERIILVGEFSVVHGEFNYETLTNESQTSMGNPYLGAEFYLEESPFFIETGFRIPVISKDNHVASVAGWASDINRMEAFTPEIVPILAAINYKTESANNILFRARLGVSFWFNSGNVFGSNNQETIFDYTVQTGYAGQKLRALVGITGRYLGTSPDGYFEKRSMNQLGATVTVPLGNSRLGAHLKLPLNETAGKLIDYVVGLNFSYNFNYLKSKENTNNK